MRLLRALALGAVTSLSACMPAGAASLPRVVDAGPAWAGADLVWGEELDDGSSRVVRWTPGTRAQPVVVARQDAARGARRDRGFGGIPGALDASAATLAWVRLDSRITHRGGDSVGSTATTRAVGGPPTGPFAPLLGRCRAFYTSVAVEGETVAIGSSFDRCAGREENGRVWLVDGPLTPRMIGRTGSQPVRQVRIAGPWVAWSTRLRLVVAERATGRVVARWRRADLGGADGIEEFDLAEDGTVFALVNRFPRPSRLVRRGPADAAPAVVAPRGASTSVAVDGGRVAFLRRHGRYARDVVVTDLAGRPVRRVDRLRRLEVLAGDLAFSGGRLAWSIAPYETGDPGRRVLRVATPG